MRFTITLSLVVLLCSCGYESSVQAQSSGPHLNGAPICSRERFYDGPIETANFVQLATDACVLGPEESASLTLRKDHIFQRLNLQMGSNTGSELEWDFCLIARSPDVNLPLDIPSQDLLRECLQYDKHQDEKGNQSPSRDYPMGLHLPAGTVLTVWRRSLPYVYCTKEGPYGSNGGSACATGQKVELIGVIQ